MTTYTPKGTLGDWTFYQVDDHGFSDLGTLYGFSQAGTADDDRGRPKVGELYNTLEHAMVAAIAEKYTGPRGAGGTGVGTAADWFMRMIGVGHLQEAGAEGGRALAQVMETGVDGMPPVGPAGLASRIEKGLDTKGYVIARKAVE